MSLSTDKIDRYNLIKPIGRGSQGIVFHAIDDRTDNPVAVKVLRDGLFATDEARKRLKREFETGKSFTHPNLVPILDLGVSHGVDFLVMPLVEGEPLDAWHFLDQPITADGIDSRRRLSLFLQIVDAVAELHRRKIIHRDLKPEHILIDDDGQPHILDFGLVSDPNQDGCTSADMFLGTRLFAAPEQLACKPIGPQADVFALGLILHLLLTDMNPRQLTRRMRPRALDSTMDRTLEAILLKACAELPEQRYTDAVQLAGEIRAYLAGKPTLAKPRSLAKRVVSGVWPYRKWLAGAAVIAMVATASVVQHRNTQDAIATTELRTTMMDREKSLVDQAFAPYTPLYRSTWFQLDLPTVSSSWFLEEHADLDEAAAYIAGHQFTISIEPKRWLSLENSVGCGEANLLAIRFIERANELFGSNRLRAIRYLDAARSIGVDLATGVKMFEISIATSIRGALLEAVSELIPDAGIPVELEEWMRKSPPIPRFAPAMRYDATRALQRIRWVTVVERGIAKLDPDRATQLWPRSAPVFSDLPSPESMIDLSLQVCQEMARWEDIPPEEIEAHKAQCLESWKQHPGWQFERWMVPSFARVLPLQWAAIAAREDLMAMRAATD